ncbi:MAG: hypothetical protein J6Z36_04705, partial [Clostridia bacterium]|nr:hypothetical protein [Clostridia bacterium]
ARYSTDVLAATSIANAFLFTVFFLGFGIEFGEDYLIQRQLKAGRFFGVKERISLKGLRSIQHVYGIIIEGVYHNLYVLNFENEKQKYMEMFFFSKRQKEKIKETIKDIAYKTNGFFPEEKEKVAGMKLHF